MSGHHYRGYDERHALDVQWLCTSCHSKTIHDHPKGYQRLDLPFDDAPWNLFDARRCRAITKAGRPCRLIRSKYEPTCHFHREAAELHE